MATKQKIYIPSVEELQWAKDSLSYVRVGYAWDTKYATFYRKSDDELHCIYSVSPLENPAHEIEKEIFRVQTTFEAIGIKFTDRRPHIN